MSLDDLQLPPFLIGELYRNNLVDLKIPDNIVTANDISYLGGNRKKSVFLAREKNAKYLEDSQLQFFTQLITACKLQMEDIALINIEGMDSITYKKLNSLLDSQTVVGFGLKTRDLDLPFDIPKYQVQKFENTLYMMSSSIVSLLDNPAEKKLLWTALKKMFNL